MKTGEIAHTISLK